MKKSSITITYDEEKLNAIRLFLTEKTLDLDAELDGFLDGLYKKYVPPSVRVYIESKDATAPPAQTKRPANPGKEQANA